MKFKAPRGADDLLPARARTHRFVENCAVEIFDARGFGEMRLPLMEDSGLFERGIGSGSDIVHKEMYEVRSRHDDDKRSLSLRPEGTAGCIRAVIQHGLLSSSGVQRLWYGGAMFRHERPQKGRRRQFEQLGAELLGVAGPIAEAELLAAGDALWKALGVASKLRLELNTLGDVETRSRYCEALAEYLSGRAQELDEDSRRRLREGATLRILDSKDPGTNAVLETAPRIDDYLGAEALAHFEEVRESLEALGIDYAINRRLVRGLDYYGRTVFEWVASEGLGAQNAVAAGGRYDALVKLLGGPATPAAGFALGVDRVVELMEAREWHPHAYMVAVDDGDAVRLRRAAVIAERLRRNVRGLRLLGPLGGSRRQQMKKADRSEAEWALIYDEREVEVDGLSMRALRGEGDRSDSEQLLSLENVERRLREEVDRALESSRSVEV